MKFGELIEVLKGFFRHPGLFHPDNCQNFFHLEVLLEPCCPLRNGIDLFEWGDEDLAVAKGPVMAGLCRLQDGFDDLLFVHILDCEEDEGLWDLVIDYSPNPDPFLLATPDNIHDSRCVESGMNLRLKHTG